MSGSGRYDESRVRAVGCPHCGEASGKRCRTDKNKIISNNYHMARKAVVYPRFAKNKQGVAAPKFERAPVRCAMCRETDRTAPGRAPFRTDVDPPGCAVCMEEAWTRAVKLSHQP